MSQASMALVPIDFFFNIVKLQENQLIASTMEGINNVEDMVEFKDDDIDNVIQNLRQPHIFQSEIPAHGSRPEVVARAIVDGFAKVLPVQAVPPQLCIDTRTEKQAPLVLSALSVKNQDYSTTSPSRCGRQTYFDKRKDDICYSKGLQ